MKIQFVCPPGSRSFLPQVLKALGTKHEVSYVEDGQPLDCDVAWVEWAAGDAAAITNHHGQIPRTIVRLHRYEVFEPVFREINWSRVSELVVTHRGILDLAREACPQIRGVPTTVLPIAVDMDIFRFRDRRRPGFKIGVVGNVIARKNPWGWLQVLRLCQDFDHRYDLHILGERRGGQLDHFIDDAIDRMALTGSVHWHAPIANEFVGSWWADKDFCLSTSWHESFCMNPREAMACGVKPVVYEYPGADEQFPGWALWTGVGDAKDMICHESFRPSDSRQWIEEHCSLEQSTPDLLLLVERVVR